MDRMKWSAVDFAKHFYMGNPIGGNFFQAKYDDYSLVLQKQYSGK